MPTMTAEAFDIDADLVDTGDVIVVKGTRLLVVKARIVATFGDVDEQDRRPIALDVRPVSRRSKVRTLRYRRTDRVVVDA